MDKIEEIKNKISEFQAKSAAKEEIKAFVTLVLQVLKNSKDSFDKLTGENLQTIKDSIAFIEAFHEKQSKLLDIKINTATGQFDADLALLKALIAKVKTIKPKNGVDGINPDPNDVVPLVIAKLPKVEPFILKRDEVVKEINLGKKDDLKIELKQIESLDKIHTKLTDSIINRAIGIVDQRTSFLINKVGNLQTIVNGLGTGGASTLAQVSAGSLTTANSLYTMTSGVPVNFQLSGGSSLLYLDETNGRIGVGTTNPASLLHIAGTPGVGAITQGITFGDGDSGIYERGDDGLTFNLANTEVFHFDMNEWTGLRATGVESAPRLRFAAGGVTIPTYAFQQDQNTGMWNAAADNLELVTNGTSRLRIDSSGNVGIGTTAPGTVLHVQSSNFLTAAFQGTSAASRVHFVFPEATNNTFDLRFDTGTAAGGNSTAAGIIRSTITQADPSTLKGDLSFFTNSGDSITEKMRIDSTGNVGIGTTGPTTLLHLSSADTQLTLQNTTATTGKIYKLRSLSGGDFDILDPIGNSAFRVNPTGFIGVHSTPTTGQGIDLFADTTTGATLGVRIQNNGAGRILDINNSSATLVTVLNGGNVGIGTTAPTAYLQIKAGTATANTAPLKFTSGTLNTTAEAGAVEFLTDTFYGTITTGAARKGFIMDNGTALTSGKIPIASTNGRLIDGQTPLAGTKVYYVSDSSGGAVTRKLTFIDGILVSET